MKKIIFMSKIDENGSYLRLIFDRQRFVEAQRRTVCNCVVEQFLKEELLFSEVVIIYYLESEPRILFEESNPSSEYFLEQGVDKAKRSLSQIIRDSNILDLFVDWGRAEPESYRKVKETMIISKSSYENFKPLMSYPSIGRITEHVFSGVKKIDVEGPNFSWSKEATSIRFTKCEPNSILFDIGLLSCTMFFEEHYEENGVLYFLTESNCDLQIQLEKDYQVFKVTLIEPKETE